MRIKPIRPSAPIREKYQGRVDAMVKEMHASLVWWLRAEYRKADPATVLLAQDASAATEIQRAMQSLAKRWLEKFDALADSLADHFARDVKSRCDNALRSDLAKGGMSVRFTMTPAMRDVFDAVRAENVSLIRSIASEHLSEVEGMLMRSVSRGRDVGYMTRQLEKRFGITRRRAAFIARDQNNKATAAMTNARHLELGITQGRWRHSGGGKQPRHSHVQFSGQVFDLREGHDFGDGFGAVLPGEVPNCRCFVEPVMPFEVG